MWKLLSLGDFFCLSSCPTSPQSGFFFHGQMKCLFVLKVTSVLCEFWLLSNAKSQLGFEFHRLTTDT